MSNPKGARPIKPLVDRLLARTVRRETGCWEWTGYIMATTGYGQIGAGRRDEPILLTHRASWMVHHGPIPDGLFVCHKCDNRPCVNPSHLFLGTHQDNMKDKKDKGRAVGAKGDRNANCKLTTAQVDDIRELANAGLLQADIAERFGITPQYVGQLHRRQWRKDV